MPKLLVAAVHLFRFRYSITEKLEGNVAPHNYNW